MNRLETKLHRLKQLSATGREMEEQRLQNLEAEFKRDYPNQEVDRSIIKLVGTLPNRGSDTRLIARLIAEKHAR